MQKRTLEIWRFITVCVWLLPLSLQASFYPDKYDGAFKDAAIFLPYPHDWRLLKAQCWQESRLNPIAVSPVGAFGLCQFMPGTAKDMKRQYGLGNLWIPEQSILAAARYMGTLGRTWRSKRSWQSRYKLALGSYNAGAGNLIKAQRKCGGAVEYEHIAPCLAQVTGKHHKETLYYVDVIWHRWWPRMQD